MIIIITDADYLVILHIETLTVKEDVMIEWAKKSEESYPYQQFCGRQQKSIGMTLTEMAILMQELGAEDAMNLDGGGSSEMVVGNEVMNRPSDGRERSVGAALAIFPKKWLFYRNVCR